MRIKFGVTLGLCLAIAACSASPDLAGSYIGGDDSARLMVQINSIKDHDIAGMMTAVTVSDDGKVTAIGKPVSGTIDSKLVNLNVENGSGISLLTGTRLQCWISFVLCLFNGTFRQK